MLAHVAQVAHGVIEIDVAYGASATLGLAYWSADLAVDGFGWPAVTGALSNGSHAGPVRHLGRELARRTKRDRTS